MNKGILINSGKTQFGYFKSMFSRALYSVINSTQTCGIMLIVCTALALVFSNWSVTAEWWQNLWNMTFAINFGKRNISMSMLELVNDALMSIFFFSVGLEIKRECIHGHLASWKQASLPIFAALGGMIVPATIYTLFNNGLPTQNGWGIPMATDIAFSLGILSMFPKKVPVSLKIFLTTLAVADDLGSIVVIALFYSGHIDFQILGIAAIVFAFLVCLNLNNVHKIKWYILPAILLWLLFLQSGVHATIAGVLIAFTIPSDSYFKKGSFVPMASELIKRYQEEANDTDNIIHRGTHIILQDLRYLTRNTIPPVQRLEYALQETVNFVIMPLFALANAGVVLNGSMLPNMVSAETYGIVLGLVCGKPLGIVLASYLVIKAGISSMPKGATLRTFIGVGLLGGIGFTMSIFVDNLAFVGQSDFVDIGKISILIGSVMSAVLGIFLLMSLKDVDEEYLW